MANIHEEWLPIIGFPTYSISSLGRTKNDISGKILKGRKQYRNGKPHKIKAYLNKSGKQYTKSVHRLMIPFLGEPPTPIHKTIDHKNKNPFDNSVSNLRWATHRQQSQNRQMSYDKRKFTMDELEVMFQKTKTKLVVDVAKEYSLSKTEISIILKFMHPEY